MTEEIVKFETAKILKEKGWDIIGDYYYTPDSQVLMYSIWFDEDKDKVYHHGEIPASTQTQVSKWLRKIHNIHIAVDCNNGDWYFSLQSITNDKYFKSQCEKNYNSYEDCLEEGILYALNLI